MSEEKTLYTFFVYMPDCTDPDAPNRRAAVRPKHLETTKRVREQGSIRASLAFRLPLEADVLLGQELRAC